jgi:hypothetical protein
LIGHRLLRPIPDANAARRPHDQGVNSSIRAGGEPPRCRYCGDVIGVYEPVILTLPTGTHLTSRLAEPNLFSTDRDCYHEVCYGLATAGNGPAAPRVSDVEDARSVHTEGATSPD